MKINDIEQLFAELKEEIIPENSHGINQMNIQEHLIYPDKRKFINPIDNSIEEHWVVFDERKTSNTDGYLIFYSEMDECFGIGTKTNMKGISETGTFIGIYGSFSDTIKSL